MLHVVKLYPQPLASLRALISENPESLEKEESGKHMVICILLD